MILLDTHIWIWLVTGVDELRSATRRYLQQHETDGLGVSIISCWEVARKVRIGKLGFGQELESWMESALGYPGVQLLGLSPEIVIEANSLPGQFHRDPADQLIVATARVLDVPVLTADSKIITYPHVQKVDVTI